MAYSALPAKVAGDTITLANYDNIRDNFAAGVPDLFTTKGDIAAATAANVATRVAVGSNGSILVADSGEASGMEWQITPGARVYNDSDIDPATSSWVVLLFNQERYDVEDCHSVVSNTSILLVPTGGAGIYAIGGSVLFDASGYAAGAARYGLQIELNATTVLVANDQIRSHSSVDIAVAVSTQYALGVGDYVQLKVYTANDIDILSSGNFSPEFWFQWLRRSP